MIVGSGLVAQGFINCFAEQDDVCVYAAGVSNSGCTDTKEFERERMRLLDALEDMAHADAFLYFSTCSVFDPDSYNTDYVQHKLAMEKLVSSHKRYLILRLPQVAGYTPNPHTLLNYLYAKICRSESFEMWRKAKRNIIDIDDIVSAVRATVSNPLYRCMTFCIANPNNYSIVEIVEAMESVVNKKSIVEICERGSEYMIDVNKALPLYELARISFDKQYLYRTIRKYYGGK